MSARRLRREAARVIPNQSGIGTSMIHAERTAPAARELEPGREEQKSQRSSLRLPVQQRAYGSGTKTARIDPSALLNSRVSGAIIR